MMAGRRIEETEKIVLLVFSSLINPKAMKTIQTIQTRARRMIFQ